MKRAAPVSIMTPDYDKNIAVGEKRREPRFWGLWYVYRQWYEVTKGFDYLIHTGEGNLRIYIPEGFSYNGASVPLLLRGINSPAEMMRSACLHDYLYGCGYRTGYTRRWSDAAFAVAMRDVDLRPAHRRLSAWLGVRLFGYFNYRRK